MNEGRKEKQIGAVVNPQDSSLSSFNVQWSGDGEVSKLVSAANRLSLMRG